MSESVLNDPCPPAQRGGVSHLHRLLPFVLGLLLVFPARAERLLIGGNGASGPLLERLCEVYGRQAQAVECRVVSPPLGSSGGVKALVSGRIDLAIVARPLNGQEQALVGRSFVLAATPFVVATRDGQRRHGFSRDELADVYAGRLRTWENGEPIRLVLRTPDDTDTVQLKAMSPAMNAALVAAEQRPGMTFASDDMDTLALLNGVHGSLGPVTLGLLKMTGSRLTVLALDGVLPSLENVRNGSYPWQRTLSVVLGQQASPAALRFAEFLRSQRAADLLRSNDYLPAAR